MSRNAAAPRRCRFRVGEPLPVLLDLKDLADIIGLSAQRTWELYKAGEFRFAERPIGNRPRFSGSCIQAWLDGQPQPEGLLLSDPEFKAEMLALLRAVFSRAHEQLRETGG